jgi:hypothetical protein
LEALWPLTGTRSACWRLVHRAGRACEVQGVSLTELGALEGRSSLQVLGTFSGTMDCTVYIHKSRLLHIIIHVIVEGLASISRSIGDLHRSCEGSAIGLAQRFLI